MIKGDYGYYSIAEFITANFLIYYFANFADKSFAGSLTFERIYFIGGAVLIVIGYLWGIRDAFKSERFRNANVFKTVLFTPGIIMFLIGWNTGFSRLIVLAASFLYFWSKYRGYWFKKPELSTA